MPRTLDWELEIEIPEVPFTGLGSLGEHLEQIGRPPTTTASRRASGTVIVPDEMADEDVRTWLVNDLAKDHVGKTVQIKHFELTDKATENS